MKIVLATSNEHKVKEINAIAEGVEFVLPPAGFEPEENGATFEENSYIKAYEAWKLSKTWTLADDSGLCIEALGGKPGIHSARYAPTASERIERVLKEMSGLEGEGKRRAKFVCAMTLLNPAGEVEYKTVGVCEGSIIEEARGVNGFGYDPIFLPDGYSKTIAELPEEEKNLISHRSKALRATLKYVHGIDPQVQGDCF